MPAIVELERRVLLTTIVVNNATDTPVEGQIDLRQAISMANSNGGKEKITFDATLFATPQTINLTGGRLNLTDTTGTESIIGPAAGLTINAQGQSRVFKISATVTASISGLTITGGYANMGSGLYNAGGTLTLSNCTIAGNTTFAGPGGGLFDQGGTTTIDGCTISGNSSATVGGGLAGFGANDTLINSTITGNVSNNGGGGGLAGFSGNFVSLTSCNISNNTAKSGPGGGLIDVGSQDNLTNCTISGNTTDQGGGGLASYSSNVTNLTGCTVTNNSVAGVGGGLLDNGGTVTLSTSSFSSNSTPNSGGGIAGYADTTTMTGCTVSSNTAGNNGGGVYNNNTATMTVSSSTINNNSAHNYGGGLCNNGTATLVGDVFENNAASYYYVAYGGYSHGNGGGGAGIYNSGSATLTSCTVDNNVAAYGYGGAVDNSGTVTFTTSTLAGNSAGGSYGIGGGQYFTVGSGGGLYNTGTAVTQGSYVNNNTTAVYGGGITNFNALTLTNSTISGNKASGNDGGMYNDGTAMLTDSTVSGNSAGNASGGIGSNGMLTLTRTTVSLNSAGNFGGGLNNFGGTATLISSSISGNSASGNDGGLYNGATATLTDSTVVNNSAGNQSGGIGNNGNLTLTRSAVNANSAGNFGGGLNNFGGTATLIGGSISGNTAEGNDGGFANSATLTLTNCSVSGNSAGKASGGGINLGTMTLTGSVVSNNTAITYGGGIDNFNTLTFTNSTLSGNRASGYDGGMYNGGTLTLTNSTVSGNSAGGSAGGIGSNGNLTLTNSTVASNSAANFGGGIVNFGGTTTLANTIIAVNTAVTGPDVSGGFASQGNNLIGETDGSSGWVGSDLTGTIGQPLNPLLAPLGDYGGSTGTVYLMALLPGSPGINAGASGAGIPTTDQRGMSRVGAVDIGAFESQGFTITVNSGSGQSAIINNAFSAPLVVSVTADHAGEPVSGGIVTFTAPSAGTSANLSSSAKIVPNGTASTSVTANSVGGTYTVTAGANGIGSGVSFSLTNTVTLKSLVNSPLSVSSGFLISGTVTASETSNNAPGIKSVAVYVATDNNPLPSTPFVVLSSGQTTFTYQGQPGHHYYFLSIATDAAGNVESKSTIDASAYVAVPPPTTMVVSAIPNTANATIMLNVAGSDTYGSGLSNFAVYVSVNGGGLQLVGNVSAGLPDGSGVSHASISYQAAADGVSRTYRFYSVGTDSSGRVEAAHTTPDLTITQIFAPAPLRYTGLTIQHGLAERSFVEFVDLNFNNGGTDLATLYAKLVANPSNYLQLIQRAVGSSTNATVSLAGVKFSLVGSSIELDFGANGLGGVARGSQTLANYWSTLAKGDGWYKLSFDATGTASFSNAAYGSFERLLGDTNGDGTVNATDVNLVNSFQGTSTNANADVNGDGVCDSTDKFLVGKSNGRSVGTNPF